MAIEQPAPRIPDKKAPRWRKEPSITPFPKPLQPPTAEEAEAANRGDYGEGRTTGFIKRHPLISGGTAAGVAATAAYEAVPAIHQAVDNTYHDAMQRLGVEIIVPPSFGNKAGSGVIGDNNTYPLSGEEAKKTDLQPVGNETSLTFLFPFQLPKGAKVQYERGIGIPEPGPAKMVPTEDRKSQEEAVAKYEELKQKGIKSEIDFVLPKDTIIVSPVSGHILVENGHADWGENPQMSPRTRIIFYNKDQDITYVLWFFGLDKGDSFQPLIPLSLDGRSWTGTEWQKLPEIQQGTPILKTVTDNQQLRLDINVYKGKVTGPLSETSSVVTPQFLTTTDAGSQKLLALEK